MSAVAVIPRPYYLQRLDELRENALIKVILGPRRCGKSFLLEMYQTRLKESGVDEQQLIVTNLDDYDSRYLRDPAALHEYITERSNDNRMHYVFIDEIQMCRDFQEVLASLSRHRNLDIYVTGSNAFLLSGELATMLTGRYSEIWMSTLSFAEFRNACKEDGLSSDQDLLRYMQIGGFPAIIPYRNNPRAIQDYYEGLVTSIIVKDICYRLNAKDAKLLDQLALCLATSIGSVISPKNLVAAIEKTGRSISVPTLYLYLQALANTATFRNYGLTRRCLYLLAGLANADNGLLYSNLVEYPQPHAQNTFFVDYALLYVSTLADYLDATGDTATANELWTVAKRQVDVIAGKALDSKWLYADTGYQFDGMPVSMVFFDWSPVKLDTHAAIQGCLANAVERLCSMGVKLGRKSEVKSYGTLLERLRKAGHAAYWDKKNHRITNGADRQTSYIATAWAVIGGLVNANEGRQAIKAVMADGNAIKPGTPYANHFLVAAMLKCGMDQEARNYVEDYWGGMVLKGADTFWEAYDPEIFQK